MLKPIVHDGKSERCRSSWHMNHWELIVAAGFVGMQRAEGASDLICNGCV
jgi:hypothetical protein